MKINNYYATAIFRITQEALTNIIKHANANNVLIQIKQKNSELYNAFKSYYTEKYDWSGFVR